MISILGLVRDNPKELTANGVTYRHPEGLLNLTQFTQVALATVAFAQTARLREAGADIWPAYFAGHSLGEYNALSAFADVIPLETVLELVFHRGSTMHHLIERDAQGRSNYRMGACARTSSVWTTRTSRNTWNPWPRRPANSWRS